MSKKVVNKKIIVTVNFRNMTEAELTTAFTKKQTAAANAPTGLTLNPTAAAVLTQIGSRGTLLNTKANLEAQLKSNTQNIHDADRALKDVFVDDWATQIQNFPNITVAQVQAMAFGVKGIDSGHAATAVEDTARNAASAPSIIKIDADVHGHHTLHTRNNLTGKIGHPKDVSRIDMYGQTGGTQPADLAALIANGGGWLGTSKRGKFVNTFAVTAANQGKPEFYIAVYIDKPTKKPAAQSKVENATIN